MGDGEGRTPASGAGRWKLLLQRIASLEPDESTERATDAELRAYREQRLDPAAAQRVERVLGSNRGARERLAALSGLDAPSPELRRRLLRTESPRRGHRLDKRVIVAAVACLCVCAPVAWWATRHIDETSINLQGASFDVSVEGIASRRSHREEKLALPSTLVRIEVSPAGKAIPDLEFGLYRLDGVQLRRLQQGDGLVLVEQDGAARFEVVAEQLAGSQAGGYDFVVAVAPRGSLPPSIVAGPSNDLELSLRSLPNTLAYRRQLTIEPPEEQPGAAAPNPRR